MDPPTLPPSTLGPHAADRDDAHVPGLLVVFAAGTATARVVPLADGPYTLGRSHGDAGAIDDGRVSRRHAVVEIVGGRCMVTDLGSQNGSFVDGQRIAPQVPTPVDRVLRLGDTLLVPRADIAPFERATVRRIDGFVRGPAMQALVDEAERVGRAGATLHVRGESGSGKEGVVQAFHRARAAHALVAVNCAAIPHALAERLLFGARRGAYSGADADAAGYVQEADGGTLFLDEIAELDLQVQAKLLRVLESKEVLPLGAAKPRSVDVAFCSATHKDLRALVAAGTLREDLYFRIGTPAITVPPLRDRPEEIPLLITHALAGRSPVQAAHVSLVERCLLRPWPGNVRELLAEIRSAAQAALADGTRVSAHHLAATAGSAFTSAASPARSAANPAPVPDAPQRRRTRSDPAWRQRIEDALRTSGGNVAATARALGLHRTQLRRLIEHHGIVLLASQPDEPDEPSEPDEPDA